MAENTQMKVKFQKRLLHGIQTINTTFYFSNDVFVKLKKKL